MKCRLLKRLRRIGRSKITIHSITTTDDYSSGMSYGFDEDEYSDLYYLGDTEEEVRDKAARIYIESYLKKKRR